MQKLAGDRNIESHTTCCLRCPILAQAMGNIHAILPDGKVVTNVEVFQRLYEQVGLGWIYAFARIGPLKAAAER